MIVVILQKKKKKCRLSLKEQFNQSIKQTNKTNTKDPIIRSKKTLFTAAYFV